MSPVHVSLTFLSSWLPILWVARYACGRGSERARRRRWACESITSRRISSQNAMKHLLRIKRKKSPESPGQLIPPGNPSGIAPGPSDLISVLDAVPGMDFIQDHKDEDQDPPASEPSIFEIAIGSPGHRNCERSRFLRLGPTYIRVFITFSISCGHR